MSDQFQFRDVFNPTVVRDLAARIVAVWPSFEADAFTQEILDPLESLGFGERSSLISACLDKYLPKDFPTAVGILVDSLEPELVAKELTGYDGFIIIPQTSFVSRNGMAHFELSMHALYEMTKRFSSEGEIRHFLIKYPEETYAKLQQWVKDPNVHVRRLVSECTRPLLPLGIRLQAYIKDPRPVLDLLEHLKTDPELYVRRSVANNLNDISKHNPDLVVERLNAWSKIKNKDTQWLIKHALRTALKDGHQGALELLGYPANPKITMDNFKLGATSIHIGDDLIFDFTIQSMGITSQDLMIDYVIDFMKKNGKTAPKVFKLAKKTIKPGEVMRIEKKQSFRPVNTRTYYPGAHVLGIQINGQVLDRREFTLTT